MFKIRCNEGLNVGETKDQKSHNTISVGNQKSKKVGYNLQ